MKKLSVLIVISFCVVISFAFRHKSYTPIFDSSLVRVDSFPNNASVSNTNTLYHAKGGITGDLSTVITPNDTSGVATSYFGALTVLPSDVGKANPPLYMSNGHYWIPFAIGTNINDSIYVRAPLHIDTITYPGHRIIYIEHADGLVSGGIVTWSQTGLKFYVSPATYWINGQYYESGLDSVTLEAANSTYSRYDLFVLDTTGHANKVTGEASMSPTVPQVDLGSQIALTNAFLVNPGDTVPASVAIKVVYNENLGAPDEFVGHTEGATMTVNFANTDNPKNGVKDAFISKYRNGSNVYWNTSVLYDISSDAVLSGWIYLNGALTNNIYVHLFNSATGAYTNFNLLDTRYGLNKNDSGHYQQFTIPLSSFTWTGNSNNQLNSIEFGFYGQGDTSGAKGLYFDWITLQKGISNIPIATDYSNKLDSVYLRNDSLFQYVKGVETFRGKAASGGSGSGNNIYNIDSTLSGNRTVNGGANFLTFTNLPKLGLGVKTPLYQFHLLDTATSSTRGVWMEQNTNNRFPIGTFMQKSRGTHSTPLIVQSGDLVGGYYGEAYNGSSYLNTAILGFLTSGTVTTSSIPTDFYIAFNPLGIIPVGTETGNIKLYLTSLGTLGLGDNNVTPDPSSRLDIKSTTQGALLPRMTTTQRDAISSPATGLLIYNITTSLFDWYNGTAWVEVGTESATSGISKLGSPTFGLTRTNDSTYIADTVNGVTSKLRGDSLAAAIGTKINISDTANKWVSSVTSLNDTTFRVTKGTSYVDIVIHSGGGASVVGVYQKIISTAGQTVFPFTLIPTDNNKVFFTRNGVRMPQSYYSISGNTLTFTSGLDLNDVVEEQGIQ